MNLIYFMRRADGVGPIKIGCSRTPERRLRAMQIWSPEPLEILASVPGDFSDEQRLHRDLADYRLHHEWFEASRKVLAVVATAAATGALPAAGANDKWVRIEALYRSGKTLAEIGQEYGITRERVRQILRKAGVPSFGLRPFVGVRQSIASQNADKVISLAEGGATVMDITREIGCCPASVRSFLRHHGVKETPAKPGAKFRPDTLERAQAIARDYEAGLTVAEITTRNSVNAAEIYRALKRVGSTASRKPRRKAA